LLCDDLRKNSIATGRAGRTPRRYRGKDANWWLARMGQYDRKVSELPSPHPKFSGKPHISGTKGGHTINLHQFARDGVILLGRLEGIANGIVKLGSDLHDNLAAVDRAEVEFVRAVDSYVAATVVSAPEETLPFLHDGFDQKILTELDLTASGIANVIWATGYSFDFSLVKVPVADGDGFPIQTRGVTTHPGLFFVGLPWLHTAKSGLIYGLCEDARYIADRATASASRGASMEVARSHAMKTWADRMTILIWSSAHSLMLDGFATQATRIYQATPHDPPQKANSLPASQDTTHNSSDPRPNGDQHE